MASRGLEMGLLLVFMAILWGGTKAESNSSCSAVLTNLSPCLDYLTGNSTTPSPACCSQLSNVSQSSPDCLCDALNGRGPSMGVTINRTIALTLPDACKLQTPLSDKCKDANAPRTSPTGPPSIISPPAGSSNATTPPPSGTFPNIPPKGSPIGPPANSSNETPPAGTPPAAGTLPNTSPTVSPTSPHANSSNETPPAGTAPTSGSGSKSTTDGSSGGSITRAPIGFVLFLVFITSCASTITKF